MEEKPILEELDEKHEKVLGDLKSKFVEKLFTIVTGKTSQGVFNNFKEEIDEEGD